MILADFYSARHLPLFDCLPLSWAVDIGQYSTEETINVKTRYEHTKRYPTSLAIREMQIKIARRYYFLSSLRNGYDWKDKYTLTGVGKGMGRLNPHTLLVGM